MEKTEKNNEWISVKDKLPKHNERVITRNTKRQHASKITTYTDFKYSEYDPGFRDEQLDPVYATHWMPVTTNIP